MGKDLEFNLSDQLCDPGQPLHPTLSQLPCRQYDQAGPADHLKYGFSSRKSQDNKNLKLDHSGNLVRLIKGVHNFQSRDP